MRSVRPAARRTFNQTLNLAKLQAVADAIVADALISNIDDHPRNHAIIARDADWKLSPTYDVPAVPVSLERRDLAMKCGDVGGSRAR
jgi:serine/threonine protein kinase HipA of HipAB toxin-antitoxin module